MLRRPFPSLLAIGLITAGLLMVGCSTKSLLSERYDEDFYEVERVLPDSIPEARYSFLTYGDTQSGWRAERSVQREEWLSWKQLYLPGVYPLYLISKGLFGAGNWARGVPDYGTEQRRAIQKALVRAADRSDARFLVHLGDIAANDGRKAYHWSYFLKDNRNYASPLGHLPFLPVPGNHDYTNDPDYGLVNWQAIFEYPLFYVKDSPSAAIFFLNSNYIVDQHDFISDERQEQLFREWFVSADTSSSPSWLERKLKQHDRPFKIIAMHHPLVSYSWHHEDWYDENFGPDLIEKRNALIRLLQKHGVQVALHGHEHLYEHSIVAPPGGAAGQTPLHTVISSGGGVPTRDPVTPSNKRERQAHFRRSGFDVSLQKQASVHHYTRVDVAPDTLVLETYAINTESGRRAARIERIRIAAPPEAQREQTAAR